MDPVVHWLVRGGLALLLAAAAIAKLRQPRDFHGVLLAYRLLPSRVVPAFARLLPWAEAGLAAGLLAGVPAAWPAAAALLLAYAVAMAINLGRGRREIDCGCGGAPQPLSGWLVGRNLLLAAAALGAWLMPPAARPLGTADALTVLVALLGCVLLYSAGHQLLANAPRQRALMEHG